MANGSFHGQLSPYTKDWAREEFYRKQEDERRETERVERASHWLASRMVGLTFTSLPELRSVCLNLTETLYGGALDEETAQVINRAVTSLWLGKVERALLFTAPVKATVTEDPHQVTFAA